MAYNREYYHKNIEYQRKHRREYYQNNPKQQQRRREYTERNREHKKEYDRIRNQAKREQILLKKREYYRAHYDREKERLRQKAKRDRNPDRQRIITTRHRARKRALPDTLTVEQWETIKRVYKYRCAYCGCKPKTLEQDHVIPISKGGGTTPENIVPACRSCNAGKGNREVANLPPVRLLV